MKKEEYQALEQFKEITSQEINGLISQMSCSVYERAASMILEAKRMHNRVHITGIGQPGHVATYAASLLSSTGTPAYFLHGTEAVHGSCGQLVAGDVVICISNSGETEELKSTVTAIHNNGCRIIAVTGRSDSWLARHAELCLIAQVAQEGGPLNRAPRASILVECLVLQALSIVLQVRQGLDPKQYVKWHPGGTLGKLREDEI